MSVGAATSARPVVLPFAEILNGHKKEDAALLVKLIGNGQVLDEKHWLLVADKDARLPRASIDIECSQAGALVLVTLHSPVYARHVFIEAEDVTAPWSDNFFDIPAGHRAVITVQLPPGIDAEMLRKRIRVKSLADVQPKNSKLADTWIRFLMVLRKGNFITWLIFKLV